MRRLMAVLVAPLASGAVYAVVAGLMAAQYLETRSTRALMAWALDIAFGSAGAIIIAFAMTLLVGMPLADALDRRGRGRMRNIIVLGALLGMLPFVAFDAYVVIVELSRHATSATVASLLHDLPRAFALAALGASCGAASAWTYWSIMERS